MRRTKWLAALGLLGLGCIESLDREDLVAGPRVLAVLVDRPEVNPGQTVTARVFLAGHRGTARYRWTWCFSNAGARFQSPVSDFGGNTPEQGCFDRDGGPLFNLGTGEAGVLPIPPDLITNALAALERGAAQGTGIPASLLTVLARDIGLVVGLGVTVEVDGRTIQAYKRVVVSSNPVPNTNPPPPRVEIAGRWVRGTAEEPTRCTPEDAAGPLRLRRGSEAALVPDPNEAPWLETYQVLTATGQLERREEQGYYHWYITGGTLARQGTRSPIRDNVWRLPAEPGTHALWVFVRDGHGGTSGCRVDAVVE